MNVITNISFIYFVGVILVSISFGLVEMSIVPVIMTFGFGLITYSFIIAINNDL